MRRNGILGILAAAIVTTCSTAGTGPAASLPDDAWLARVKENLSRMEYEFRPLASGVISAPNRENGFRTAATPAGIEVTSRLDGNGWRVSLSAASWGRTGAEVALTPGLVGRDGAKITIERGTIVERYVNDPSGLEQVIELHGPPQGPRDGAPLVFAMSLGGDLLASSDLEGTSILLSDPQGKPLLKLAALHVTDAGHRDVPARFRLSPGRLAIEIDDRDAVYPLRVDPLLTTAQWTAESNQASAVFGASVSTAGDVNGDGYSDVIIGAPAYDNGQTDEGRVFLYLGSATGLSATAARTFESNQTLARFGSSVTTAGDLNGDGFDDFAVGAERWDGTQTDEGAVFVYTGASATASIALAKTLVAGNAGARFGYSVAYGGDVDGDGNDDLVVGAPYYTNGQSQEGAVFVYRGDASTVISTAAPFKYESDQANANLGIHVAGGVDVNADGFDDVFAGAWQWDSSTLVDAGLVVAFYGSATGLPAAPSWSEVGSGGLFGGSVAALGDTNGDGYADIAIGASDYTNTSSGEGRIYIYRGSSAGLLSSASQTRDGGSASANLGSEVAPAGDVNGDGFADVAASAPGFDPGGLANAGEIRVWEGSKTGIPTAPSWVFTGDQANEALGAVFAAGDVNGDGYADLVVGASDYDHGQTDEGRAYVFLGSGDGPSTTALAALHGTDTTQTENFGFSVASAGDVNADGFSDVIVGDPQYGGGNLGGAFVFLGTATGPSTVPSTTLEGTQFEAAFGQAVAGAGDVNGDGYDDVIVGAPSFNVQANDTDGKFSVFYGGANGVGIFPAYEHAEHLDTGRHMGSNVAGIGDVNGDGYADIAVSGSIGRGTEVRYGSATGIHDSPYEFLDGENVEAAGDVNGDGLSDVITNYYTGLSSQASYIYFGGTPRMDFNDDWAKFGQFESAVHAAGDVDGDGYDDVVYHKSAATGSEESLYLGGPTGPSLTTPDQSLSFSVRNAIRAGDVNGDGYADLMVNAGSNVMKIYLGSPSGYSSTAAWSATSPGINFGDSFAPAGDVNGDGFSDVIVGAPGGSPGGSAFVYLGGGGDGLDFIPRNYRGDNSGPAAFLGSSGSTDRFRILSRGRNPRGRAFISMDHQVAPLGTPIASGTFVHGNAFDTGTTDSAGADVNFNRLVSGLTPQTSYKWRMRFSTADPVFPRTRWISLPGNGPEGKDISTPCVTATYYRDFDQDGFGGSVTQVACSQPVGYVTVSGDCNDNDATMFPGNPEICDGKDNDCNGTVDDFAAPVGAPSLGASKSGSSVTFSWAALAGADRYDAVRGGLVTLRSSGGDFSTLNTCLANDAASPSATDPAAPVTGDGFWYLVRGVACATAGTYDEGTASQQGSRDSEIAASPAACP